MEDSWKDSDKPHENSCIRMDRSQNQCYQATDSNIWSLLLYQSTVMACSVLSLPFFSFKFCQMHCICLLYLSDFKYKCYFVMFGECSQWIPVCSITFSLHVLSLLNECALFHSLNTFKNHNNSPYKWNYLCDASESQMRHFLFFICTWFKPSSKSLAYVWKLIFIFSIFLQSHPLLFSCISRIMELYLCSLEL